MLSVCSCACSWCRCRHSSSSLVVVIVVVVVVVVVVAVVVVVLDAVVVVVVVVFLVVVVEHCYFGIDIQFATSPQPICHPIFLQVCFHVQCRILFFSPHFFNNCYYPYSPSHPLHYPPTFPLTSLDLRR